MMSEETIIFYLSNLFYSAAATASNGFAKSKSKTIAFANSMETVKIFAIDYVMPRIVCH